VPVEALYDRDASHRVMLRNLLQRAGYDSIEAIRAEGLDDGIERTLVESILDLLTDRGLTLNDDQRARVAACHDHDQLRAWLRAAARVSDPAKLFSPPA
jgi:hypothetical protein